MKFKITKKDLEKALNINMRATPTRGSLHLPILKGIYLEVRDGELTLCTTDMVTTIVTHSPCDTEEEGKAVIFAHAFSEVVRELPESLVKIEGNEKGIDLTCERISYHFRGLEVNDFPKIPELDTNNTVNLGIDFLGAVLKVIGCVSKEELMTAVTGILFENRKNRLRLVGTDGFRLALCEIDSETQLKVTVPNKVLEILDDFAGQSLEMSCSENKVMFSARGTPDVFIYSQLLAGTFPDYSRAIPRDNETRISTSSTELISAVRRMLALNPRLVTVTTLKDENSLQISCETDEGKGTSSISANIEGKDIEFNCNPQFLLDGLKRVGGDEIIIETTSNRPILMKSDDDYDFIYVFMPMKNQ